jgi:hypothetical protein
VFNVPKRILKKGLKLPVQLVRRHKAKNALTQLTLHSDPKLKALGVALQESLARSLSAHEQQAISLIEQRRSLLLDSDKPIAVVDYGAGSSSSNRTREEMEKGVPLTLSIAAMAAASKPAFWATVLFKIIRKLAPQSCVELGSCVGISASYQASALNMNGNGTIVTLEGSAEVARLQKRPLNGWGSGMPRSLPAHSIGFSMGSCRPPSQSTSFSTMAITIMMQSFDTSMSRCLTFLMVRLLFLTTFPGRQA